MLKKPFPAELIERRIYLIRGHKVMIDSDLAELYQVPTFRLNEAVKRKAGRFPEDFMFQLTALEEESLTSQIAMSKTGCRGLRWRSRAIYTPRRRHVMRFAAVFISCLFFTHAEEMGALRNLAEIKLAPMPGMPGCISMAVESGDPHKGASVIVFKGTAGCVIPWHWHTPAEHVMMVSGSAKVEMKGGKTVTLTSGGYGMMMSKHAHQFTCTTACTAFVSSDGAFDIHYLDANGKEISSEAALGKK